MFKNKTVVIIDDSEDDLLFAEYLLNKGGYGQVIKTYSLAEGINAVKEYNAQVVMLDLMGLPDISDVNPTSAYRMLKEECPNVNIIVLSGNHNPEIKQEVKAGGAIFLSKQEALRVTDSDAEMGSLARTLSETFPSKLLESRIIYLETHIARLEGYLFNSLASRQGVSAPHQEVVLSNAVIEIAALRERVKHLEEREQDFVFIRDKCNSFESFFLMITGNSSEDRQELVRLRDELVSFNRDMRTLELRIVTANAAQVKEIDIDTLIETSRKYKWLFTWICRISDFSGKLRTAVLANVYKEVIGVGILVFAGVTSPKWMPVIKFIEKSLVKAVGGDN